jgi:hypothetical protein
VSTGWLSAVVMDDLQIRPRSRRALRSLQALFAYPEDGHRFFFFFQVVRDVEIQPPPVSSDFLRREISCSSWRQVVKRVLAARKTHFSGANHPCGLIALS